MIEWLSNDRVTFYERVDEETEKNCVQKIRWVKIRRMENLYTIYGRQDYLINVSVDFRLFIDVKKSLKIVYYKRHVYRGRNYKNSSLFNEL